MKRLGDRMRCVRDHAGQAGLVGRIGPADLVAGQHRVRAHRPAPTAARADPRSLRFQANDLLFSAIRPSRQRLAVARSAGTVTPEVLVLRPTLSPADAFACLAHPQVRAEISRRASGTRVPRVTWKDLQDLQAPPPLTTTRGSLVACLLDRLSLLHRRDLAERELLRIQGARPRNDGPRLRDIATLRTVRRRDPPLGASVRTGDLRPGGLAVYTRGAALTASHVPVQAGDLLVSAQRPSTHAVGIAPGPGHASAEVFVLEVEARWRTAVAAWLVQPATARDFGRWAGGTRLPRLPRELLLEARIPGDRLESSAPLVARAIARPSHAAAIRHALEAVIQGA